MDGPSDDPRATEHYHRLAALVPPGSDGGAYADAWEASEKFAEDWPGWAGRHPRMLPLCDNERWYLAETSRMPIPPGCHAMSAADVRAAWPARIYSENFGRLDSDGPTEGPEWTPAADEVLLAAAGLITVGEAARREVRAVLELPAVLVELVAGFVDQ